MLVTLRVPCFEQRWPTWRAHGEYRTSRYLEEYEIPGRHATDFHRPLATYLNELAHLGCRISEIAEPGLNPEVAAEAGIDGMDGYVHLRRALHAASRSLV